ncbi:hypothetical protein [Gardnerella vaginalis]|nr:hypothetical protein [Gardnerella vaginalis]
MTEVTKAKVTETKAKVAEVTKVTETEVTDVTVNFCVKHVIILR